MFEAVRAVLFDLDGTLIHQTIDFDHMRRAVLAVVARFGLAVEPLAALPSLEAIARAAAALERRAPGAGGPLTWEAQRVITSIELAAAEGADAFDGVPEALAALRAAGYRVGIVTRNCRPAVERVLARRPLPCDVLLTRDDVCRVKPDPEQLLIALRRLGVAGVDALMCGDHAMDVIAGRRVGAATVGILSDDLPLDRFATVTPDLVLRSVAELPRHLPRSAP